MLETLWDQVKDVLALDSEISDVGAGTMALRTVIVYVFTLAIVRLGSKRFLSKATPFDVLVAVMLGSIVSRAINGSAPFFATLFGAGLVLIAIHWLLATLSARIVWFGPIVKGQPRQLIKDGEIQWDAMREGAISRRDLDEVLRLEGYPTSLSGIEAAYLERNGDVSVIPSKSAPKTVQISVLDGVQTVRIQLE